MCIDIAVIHQSSSHRLLDRYAGRIYLRTRSTNLLLTNLQM
jgi:hypothetical protein